MRRVRYAVATSLDGYIAGPNGEADWIVPDPEFDFATLFAEFDTLLIGRRTFETMMQAGRAALPGMKNFVFSRTLQQRDHPDVTIVAQRPEKILESLREKPGKDIWLFGGGSLFHGLLKSGLVDTIEVSIMPVLLGGGIPLLPSPADRRKLKLTSHGVNKVGIVSLKYDVT
jgi:dihydrofolate reductase